MAGYIFQVNGWRKKLSICGNCYFILTLLGIRHETVAFFCPLTWSIWTSCPQLPPASFSRARLARPICDVQHSQSFLLYVIVKRIVPRTVLALKKHNNSVAILQSHVHGRLHVHVSQHVRVCLSSVGEWVYLVIGVL